MAPRLQGTSSTVVAHGLRGCSACGLLLWVRDGTCDSRIGRWILYHWTSREAPQRLLIYIFHSLNQHRGNVIPLNIKYRLPPYGSNNHTLCYTILYAVSIVYIITAAAKSLQSCPILCNPIDGSPPGSPVPGILQARTLEWVAISFSNTWKWKVKGKSLSHVWLLATSMDCSLPSSSFHGILQARVLEWGATAFSIYYIYMYLKITR